MHANRAAHAAFKNRSQLPIANIAGCFNCIKMFEPKEVNQFTDNGQTALCPYCLEDTVLLATDKDNLSVNDLLESRRYWLAR